MVRVGQPVDAASCHDDPAVRRVLFAVAVAACGVRTPPRADVDALLRAKGAEATRFDLEAAVLADPRDVGARLALAAVADRLGRPSEAIEHLEIVEHLGGPLGTRWHDEDRARLARLIAARGQARLERGAASAADDLERARSLGAAVDDAVLRRAHLAAATVDLRHIDAGVRERGKRVLAFVDDPRFRGARPNANVAERGVFGAWLWTIGARRGAWGELAAWHDATPAPRDPALEAAYVSARTWWTPVDAPTPGELAGPERCRFGACTAAAVAAGDDPAELHALLGSATRTADPEEAIAWIDLGLRAALRGQGSWGAIVRAHLDLARLGALRSPYRELVVRLTGQPLAAATSPAGGRDRLASAAAFALIGAPLARIRAELGPDAESPDGAALLGLFAAPTDAAGSIDAARVASVTDRADQPRLAAIAAAFHRDPAIAERLGRDYVARSADAAVAHAVIGGLFGALGDPARSRLAWQAAVDASPEPAFLLGLAEIEARAGDPDAAMINATTAAAAAGDPAETWLVIARAIEEGGAHAVALDAAKNALDLATADTLDGAFDVAIAASLALGRESQVAQLVTRRTTLAIQRGTLTADEPARGDPTDVAAALVAHRDAPSASTLAHLWVASRWNPRDVASRAAIRAATPVDDARRAAVTSELIRLAAEPRLARAALAALR